MSSKEVLPPAGVGRGRIENYYTMVHHSPPSPSSSPDAAAVEKRVRFDDEQMCDPEPEFSTPLTSRVMPSTRPKFSDPEAVDPMQSVSASAINVTAACASSETSETFSLSLASSAPLVATASSVASSPVVCTSPLTAVASASVFTPDDRNKLNKILTLVCSTDEKIVVLSQKVSSLEQAVAFHDSELEAQKAVNVAVGEENRQLLDKVSTLTSRVEACELGLRAEAFKRDNSENISRKQCLEFSGVPKLPTEKREDPKKFVGLIMALAGSKNKIDAIDDAHRKMGGGIIARFKSREQRNEVYERRFALNDHTSAELPGFENVTSESLYMNESLTFDRSKLMKNVRDKLKILNRGIPKAQWFKSKTEGGFIKVQNVGGNYIKILSMDDFDRLHPNNITLKPLK